MVSPKTTKILIVDDDPGHLVSLKTVIRSWGYAAETADDGDAAVDVVKSGAHGSYPDGRSYGNHERHRST